MFLLSRFMIHGHSMEPNFHPRDFVLISEIPLWFRKPKVGDVVLFKENEKYIVKRVVNIKNEKYIVKGDNINDSKEFGEISREEILGKVIYHVS